MKNWEFTTLLKRTFSRLKERFGQYAWLLFFSFLVGLSQDILQQSLTDIFSNQQQVGILLTVIISFFGIIVQLILSLGIIIIIISKDRLDPHAAFTRAKSFFLGYIWLLITNALFLLCLFPFGIVTLCAIYLLGTNFINQPSPVFLAIIPVLTVALLGILWTFWGSFMLFVYLEKKYRGLKNLWVSRQMINQRFWAILWRAFLINIPLIAINALVFRLSYTPPGQTNLFLSSSRFYLLYKMLPFIILPISLFITSFMYEMYQDLPQPTTIKKPTIWIWAMIGAAILSIVLGTFSVRYFKAHLPKSSTIQRETQNARFNKDMDEVKKLWDTDHGKEALKKAKSTLSDAKTNQEKAEAHLWIGFVNYKQQNPTVAEAEYQLAIRLDPQNSEPYHRLSIIEIDKGNFQNALEYAQKCAKLNPKDAFCENSLGLALISLGRKEEGIQHLEKAVALAPDQYGFRENLLHFKNSR